MAEPLFRDRHDAGRRLAGVLRDYAARPGLLVLALPRGGVPVGYEVAQALDAPLDVFLVRKLGVPGHEELAMGAIASGGVQVLNDEVVGALGIPAGAIAAAAQAEGRELARREAAYRAGRPAPPLAGRTVLLVDDGLATGATMRAAAQAVASQQPAELVIAVPVAAVESCRALEDVADRVVCPATPDPFYAVGAWYADFGQTTDAEVTDLLRRAAGPAGGPVARP